MACMKKVLLALLALTALLALGACGNRTVVDTVYTFDRAIIALPDGSWVEGKVDSWRDFENSDQLQVTIDDVTYLTHSTNVVLISE